MKKKRIDERPKEVETRERIGDWEGDTIVGSDKSHILTHVDRKSGYAMADKLTRGLAELTRLKTIERFKRIAESRMAVCSGCSFRNYSALYFWFLGTCLSIPLTHHSCLICWRSINGHWSGN